MPRPCNHTEIVENCKCCELYVKFRRHRHFWDTGERLPPDPSEPLPAALPAQKIKRLCPSIGKQLEVLATCPSGWRCLHECNSNDPRAIKHLSGIMQTRPSVDCQECECHPDYKPDN